MRLLALDTATEHCSAALWLKGQVSALEELRSRGHGERILPMIEQLLTESGISLRQLDAIAVGRGPGAFTGVRLAVSVAQGLAYAAGLPLIPVSNLQALAYQAAMLPETAPRMLVCQDARMDEVYWGCFERRNGQMSQVGPERVSAAAAVRLPDAWRDSPTIGVGSGFAAYRQAFAALAAGLTHVREDLTMRARDIAQLAAEQGLQQAVPAHEAQPVYLRDEVAKVPQHPVDRVQSRN